jgi:hypothetical protein
MSQEIDRPRTRRQVLLALGAGAAAVAAAALAPATARAQSADSTQVEKLLPADKAKLLTPKAAKLTRADLVAMHDAAANNMLDAFEKKHGLTAADIASINKAFVGYGSHDNLKKMRAQNITCCTCCCPCCTCAAAVTLPVRTSRVLV